MKAYNINLCTEMQAGREITLYIYTFDERLNESPFELDDKDEEGKIKKIKYIFTKNEEKKFKFYYDLLIDIEKKLEAENIIQTVKNGCAYGVCPVIYLDSSVSLTPAETTNNITTWNIN